MACGKCLGSQLPGPVGEVLCEQNWKIFYGIAAIIVAAIGVLTNNVQYYSNLLASYCNASLQTTSKIKSNEEECIVVAPLYKPFALSLLEAKAKPGMVEIASSPRMEGTDKNNIMVAAEEGSKTYAGLGSNYIKNNPGADENFFSICTAEIINGTVTVVEGFDPIKDKVKIFCSEHILQENDRTIRYDPSENVTYIDIFVHQDIHEYEDITAIAFLGKIDLTNSIILNEPW